MTTLADGGALADATFVVNLAIAVGTIGAASVALWLGVRAANAERRRELDAQVRGRRQTFAVFLPRVDGTVPTSGVEVVNGSDEAISGIAVLATILPSAAQPDAQWRMFGDAEEYPNVRYLLAGERRVVLGRFQSVTKAPDDPEFSIWPKRPNDISVQISWLDTRGAGWTRVDLNEPFASSPAMPGRPLRGFVPRPRRRWYWPVKTEAMRSWEDMFGEDVTEG